MHLNVVAEMLILNSLTFHCCRLKLHIPCDLTSFLSHFSTFKSIVAAPGWYSRTLFTFYLQGFLNRALLSISKWPLCEIRESWEGMRNINIKHFLSQNLSDLGWNMAYFAEAKSWIQLKLVWWSKLVLAALDGLANQTRLHQQTSFG